MSLTWISLPICHNQVVKSRKKEHSANNQSDVYTHYKNALISAVSTITYSFIKFDCVCKSRSTPFLKPMKQREPLIVLEFKIDRLWDKISSQTAPLRSSFGRQSQLAVHTICFFYTCLRKWKVLTLNGRLYGPYPTFTITSVCAVTTTR